MWCVLAHVACAQDLPLEGAPPGTLFYYPMSVAAPLDPNTGDLVNDTVYIVSTNFDQRFDSGWVTELNVPALQQVLATAGGNDIVAVRSAFRASLKVPTLGGGMSVSSKATQAFIPHRGTGLVTVMDIDSAGSPHCGDPTSTDNLTPILQRTDCDRNHLVDLVALALANNLRRSDFQDPFATAVVPAGPAGGPFAAVGYLSGAWLTVLEVPDVVNPSVNLRRHVDVGSGALASLQPTPNSPDNLTATSRKIDTTQDLSTVYDINVIDSLTAADANTTRTYVNQDVGGQDIYNAAYSADGTRLFVTNRGPDAVVALQKETPPLGGILNGQIIDTPKMQVTSAAVLDGTLPADLVYLSRNGASDLVAVAGMLQDSIYFLSPRNGVLQLVARIKLTKGETKMVGNTSTVLSGKGPYGMLRVQRAGQFDYLVVSTFYDHGVSIIDVSGPEVLNYREVTHISESGILGNAQRSR